jgi:DNA-binding MarR family transcriptional regulator
MEGPPIDPFDPILHSGPRITIIIRLVTHGSMRLSQLAKSTGLSPGNVGAHVSVLEAAGYVEKERVTTKVESPAVIRITAMGDAAFRNYVAAVRAALAQYDVKAF